MNNVFQQCAVVAKVNDLGRDGKVAVRKKIKADLGRPVGCGKLGQVRRGRLDDHLLIRLRIRVAKFGGLLGYGDIVKHENRTSHVAQLVAPIRIRDGVVALAGNQVAHRLREIGNQTGNQAAEPNDQCDCDTDQENAAESRTVMAFAIEPS